MEDDTMRDEVNIQFDLLQEKLDAFLSLPALFLTSQTNRLQFLHHC